MKCRKCLVEKELSEFYKHPWTKEWVLHFCKDCKREYAIRNRTKEKDRERYRTSWKKRLNVLYHWIMSRCYDKNNSHYKRYGWRWIKVLWKNYKEFYNDMIEEYIKHRKENWEIKNRQTQIDRIDNNWNYCKENCRRVNAKENNQRNKILPF